MTRNVGAIGLVDELAHVRRLVQVAVGAKPTDTPEPRRKTVKSRQIERLVSLFDLSQFERDVLVLAALPSLEPDGAALLAEAQGDSRLRVPTVAFALSALPDSHWSAFAAESPLRRNGLIVMTDEPLASARGLVLSERILHYLVGLDQIDEFLVASAVRIAPLPAIAKSHRAMAKQIAERLSSKDEDAPVIQLLTTERRLAAGIAEAAARDAGLRAYVIDADALPASLSERTRAARAWGLENRLGAAVAVVDTHDAGSPQDLRAAARFSSAIAGPVLLLAADPVSFSYRTSERFEVERPTLPEQKALWEKSLGSLSRPIKPFIATLASQFAAPPDAIHEIAAKARDAAKRPPSANGKALKRKDRMKPVTELIWRETRSRTRPRLDELAQRIEARAGWDDIILPQRQMETLRAIAAQVRQRYLVHHGWGFKGHGGRGLGISALFSGPSGTGKTLAAEVLGAALGLDVYRIDLSAVVSKWIGQTEKNLRRVFDAADDGSAIMLFDEADALFSKRSEVRDSHDRYANIEVSYLLQRIETYRGLAILTTNMRAHIDSAFLRRIRFLVEFPFPGEAERREIWRLAIPDTAPRDGLDMARLAQFNVAGGNIRNIALNAAFIAADAGASISMAHVRAAARAEYEKLGKTLTDGELRGWTQEARHG